MIAIPETTLNEKTYTNEESKKNILDFSTSAEVVECYPSEKFEVEYPDELAGFSEEAKARLFHSLKQTKTKSLGSFSQYIDSPDE